MVLQRARTWPRSRPQWPDLLSDALVDVPVTNTDEDEALRSLRGSVRLLPASGTAPNAAELLASQRMPQVVKEAEGMSDLVIIDTNPLLAVSDSMPLLDLVSGVVLVAEAHLHDQRCAPTAAKDNCEHECEDVGVVATGAAGGLMGRYGYGPGYGYYGYTSHHYAKSNGVNGDSGVRRRKRSRSEKPTR